MILRVFVRLPSEYIRRLKLYDQLSVGEAVAVWLYAKAGSHFPFGDVLKQTNDLMFSFAHLIEHVMHRLARVRYGHPLFHEREAALDREGVMLAAELLPERTGHERIVILFDDGGHDTYESVSIDDVDQALDYPVSLLLRPPVERWLAGIELRHMEAGVSDSSVV